MEIGGWGLDYGRMCAGGEGLEWWRWSIRGRVQVGGKGRGAVQVVGVCCEVSGMSFWGGRGGAVSCGAAMSLLGWWVRWG
jgi:hypothetical protein